MSCPAHPSGEATLSLRLRIAIGLAALALLAVVLAAAACGDGGEKAAPTPTPTPSPTPPATPGPPPEVLFQDEIPGALIILEYRTDTGTYFANVSAVSAERYREGKAALEERLPSLVPDPCEVLWTTPALMMDELGPEDLETSGC